MGVIPALPPKRQKELNSGQHNTLTQAKTDMQHHSHRDKQTKKTRTVSVGADQRLGARVGVNDGQTLVSDGVVAVHLLGNERMNTGRGG